MSTIYLLLILLFSNCTTGDKTYRTRNYSLIPLPHNLVEVKGYFTLDEYSTIHIDTAFKDEAEYLKALLLEKTKLDIDIKYHAPSETSHSIILEKDKFLQRDEEYAIQTMNNKVIISANNDEGIFRGIQSFYQLLLLNSDFKKKNFFIPNLIIDDWASFPHRGMLMDCCRHFFSKEVVKKYIDLLAFYKMNTLHWHLTEDQGWRIAIDKYPKLTEISAWRKDTTDTPYGGFYSKEEIREIVQYATERHINIIPEIEMPGHSQAALAAYPNLSCTGNQIEVANEWGVFKDIYCAGNEDTFKFLEDVLTEVIELFPSEYIHIGGDEAPKFRWEHCAKCQARIKAEGLKDEHELQSYFIKRIEKFLISKGKKLIGWDEILEGGLSNTAIVQSWRGMEGGIKAIQQGNQVIMSPTSHAYFDYSLKSIDLKKVYDFKPVPRGFTETQSKNILGGECNLWSENIPTEVSLDNKAFPRLLAMAEVLWSDSSHKDFEYFRNRVQDHYPVLKALNVKYGMESIPFKVYTKTDGKIVAVHILKNIKDIDIRYRSSVDENWIKAKNIGKLPEWHESADGDA